MWMAPNVTNGVILSYTVEVRLLTEGGHTVYAHNYTVTVGGMPPTSRVLVAYVATLKLLHAFHTLLMHMLQCLG